MCTSYTYKSLVVITEPDIFIGGWVGAYRSIYDVVRLSISTRWKLNYFLFLYLEIQVVMIARMFLKYISILNGRSGVGEECEGMTFLDFFSKTTPFPRLLYIEHFNSLKVCANWNITPPLFLSEFDHCKTDSNILSFKKDTF